MASIGTAPGLHPGICRFDSDRFHQILLRREWAFAKVSYAFCRQFDSDLRNHFFYWRVADLAKHVIVNHTHVGSNPSAPAIALLVQSGKTAACQVANIGSNPIQCSKSKDEGGRMKAEGTDAETR